MEFEAFLKEYGIYLSIAIFVLVIIFILFMVLYPRLKKGSQVDEVKRVDEDAFYLALGGKDNIKSIRQNGSRLSVELIDMTRYDKDKLKDLGVPKIIVMTNKLVLLVDESFKQIGKEK